MRNYDLIVLGGGPGGYPAAIRASQLGMNVALIEGDALGGECTNYGCIPTKALMYLLNLVDNVKKLPVKSDVKLDFKEISEWLRNVVMKVRSGIEYLLKGYGVDIIKGWARFTGKRTLEVMGLGELRFKKAIIAVGTHPKSLKEFPFDKRVVIDNRSFFMLNKIPSSMTVIGGGPVGIEFATILSKLGCKVHLVEEAPRLLTEFDKDIARGITRSLKKLGVILHINTKIKKTEINSEGVKILFINGESIECEKVLVAIGRKPNTEDLGLEKAKVIIDEEGFVIVDHSMRTSNPHIYASGDVTGPPFLAHKAFYQGVVAAEAAAGLKSKYDPKAVPNIVFSDPEVVSVGLSEDEARDLGFNVKTSRLPISALARGIMEGEEGFVKIVSDDEEGTILGIHMIGPRATELSAEMALVVEMGLTAEDLVLTLHPHPTFAEAIKEAAELHLGRPIHILLKRKIY